MPVTEMPSPLRAKRKSAESMLTCASSASSALTSAWPEPISTRSFPRGNIYLAADEAGGGQIG